MRAFKLVVFFLAVFVTVCHFIPVECSALEYCWNLTYPGTTAPPDTIKVGVLDIGGGHYILSGSGKEHRDFPPYEYTTYAVIGGAELIDKILNVTIVMSSRSDKAVLPGGTSVMFTQRIHMRVDPTTLSGDYARILDHSNGAVQLKGSFLSGTVTSVSCN
ncbi:MAG: hypothetical protein HQK58_06335 [Deltaproteobacteria bacterium]|nr:hypothetical protein [Deltaproteobacteria bacterium]